jgi:hypothetical protein
MAPAVISGHLSFGELLLPEGFQPFGRAETFIDLALLKQLIRIIPVDRQTLRLAIRTIRAFPVRALIPLNSQPLEVLQDMMDGVIRRSLQVCVLNPEDKCSLMVFCKEIVEQSGSGISDMEKTCWRWSEADTDT